MDAQATAFPASEPTGETARLVYFLRRLTAWMIDGMVIAVPVLIVGFGLFVVMSFAMGTGFALAGGGLDGLVAGSAVSLITVPLVVFGSALALFGVPAGYLRWAAHRTGPNAGQTLGQQLFDLRVVRSHPEDGRAIRGRTLIGRALLMYIGLFALSFAPLPLVLLVQSQAITKLVWLLLVGVLVWRATDGRLPHDRLSGTRMADVSDEPGGWDATR